MTPGAAATAVRSRSPSPESGWPGNASDNVQGIKDDGLVTGLTQGIHHDPQRAGGIIFWSVRSRNTDDALHSPFLQRLVC